MRAEADRSSSGFLIVAAAALLVVFGYMGALSGPFVFDDEHNIAENRFIRISAFDPAGLYAAAFKSPLPNRPIANVSFAFNYYFNGTNVVGYRFVNILIHIINGFLVFGLARITLQTPALVSERREASGLAAAFAAALWMLHPLHTQSVGYIVQRMTSLAVLFYLLSMLCYIRARLTPEKTPRRIALYGIGGLAGLLALGSKEIAATLPFFIYLYEWFFLQRLNRGWLRRSLPALAGVCILSAAIGLVFIGSRDPLGQILAPYSDGTISAFQRLLTQARAVWFYISLLIWPAPSRLNLDHDFPFSFSLLDPIITLPAVLALAGLLVFAIFLARRDALSAYAVLWFLGNLVIESSVIRLETLFEHRTYLPSVMPVAASAALVFRWLGRKRAAAAVLTAVALLWAGWTWQRSQVWGDAVALWQDCVNKSPAKARPYNNLGSALSERNQLPDAAANFQKAIDLRPDYADAHYNLGYAWVRLGRLQDGLQQLLEAVRLEPGNYMAHNNIGVAYLLQENYPEAIRHLQQAVELAPEFETARNNLAVALRGSGDLEGAIYHLEQAIRANPSYAEAYNNLGLTLKEQGKFRQAVENFSRALAINPAYAAARLNLEETQAQLKRAGG